MSQNLMYGYQVINGYIALTSFCAMFIFLHYLYVKRHLGYVELRPAIALLVVWVADVILRGNRFLHLTFVNADLPIVVPWTGLIIGGTLLEIGFLCCIRVFAPEEWRYWSWLGTFLFSTAVVGASFVYVAWR